MDKSDFLKYLNEVLDEIREDSGIAATERFANLRQVDAKVREVRTVLKQNQQVPESLINEMDSDVDFSANSRRVRLEALANYCVSILKLIDKNITRTKLEITGIPDILEITKVMPGLDKILARR